MLELAFNTPRAEVRVGQIIITDHSDNFFIVSNIERDKMRVYQLEDLKVGDLFLLPYRVDDPLHSYIIGIVMSDPVKSEESIKIMAIAQKGECAERLFQPVDEYGTAWIWGPLDAEFYLNNKSVIRSWE